MSDDGNETVTPQQTELIVSYSAATGNDDLDVCQSNLREHNWDLSAAINATMSSPPFGIQQSSSTESLSINGDGVRHRVLEAQPEDLSIPSPPPIGPLQLPNAAVVAHSNVFTSLVSSFIAFTRLLISSPHTIFHNVLSLFRNWWGNMGPDLTTLQQIDDFQIKFNKKYDQILWLNCSYASAIASIRSNLKPVVIYLANEQKQEDMDQFATLLIALNNELKSRIQFWGCDISQPEGARTADALYVGTFPSILIIGLQSNQQSVLYRTCVSTIAIEELKSQVELAESELVTARHEAQIRQMDRNLREEQDVEFQRTMEADQKRLDEEKKKREEEELKLRAVEEREILRIQRQTAHRERRISAKQSLAPEPESGGIRIQFKLPNGSRATRTFLDVQPVGDLFLYVQSLDDSPGDCFLSTVFPTRKILQTDNTLTLSHFGIKNNEQLMVQAIISEYSDDSDESDESD